MKEARRAATRGREGLLASLPCRGSLPVAAVRRPPSFHRRPLQVVLARWYAAL